MGNSGSYAETGGAKVSFRDKLIHYKKLGLSPPFFLATLQKRGHKWSIATLFREWQLIRDIGTFLLLCSKKRGHRWILKPILAALSLPILRRHALHSPPSLRGARDLRQPPSFAVTSSPTDHHQTPSSVAPSSLTIELLRSALKRKKERKLRRGSLREPPLPSRLPPSTPTSVAAPSVNPNLRRVLFTAIGAPSAAAPCSLLITGK
ncbi:hypothetical protein PIB30_082071 [Stylosanthes scabra]|uniref:Uncharacterized protein n=1 Tax=Stylosanthes scabra TaxID=79078 RepID=A0ABU6TRE1_9FABA|nr:hypothetical protein [Stylosanthes scabra]